MGAPTTMVKGAAATTTVEGAAAMRLHPPPFATLYVGDLDPSVSDDDLIRAFVCYGALSSVRICRDAISRNSLGYGYVNFVSFDYAEAARKALNHAPLNGKPMRIMWSHRDPLPRRTSIGNLFVKNLDLSVTATELEDLFAVHGPVISCKVAVDESGRSKGFGFVQMGTEEAAQRAIAVLNGVLFCGKSKPLYVAKFVKRSERHAPAEESNSANLYIKNMDRDLTDDLLRETFSKFGEIRSAVVMKDELGKSRRFGFVSFQSPEHAKNALEVMNGAQLGTKSIYVGVAQRKAERKELLTKQFEERRKSCNKIKDSTVYVKNLNDSVDDKALLECFGGCGKITSTKVIYDSNGSSRGFGFVCFSSPEEAQKAVAKLNGTMFHGKSLYVAIARERSLPMQHPVPNSYHPGYYYCYPQYMHQQYSFQFAPHYPMLQHYQMRQLPWANGSLAKSASVLMAGPQHAPSIGQVNPTQGRLNVQPAIYGKNGGLNFRSSANGVKKNAYYFGGPTNQSLKADKKLATIFNGSTLNFRDMRVR